MAARERRQAFEVERVVDPAAALALAKEPAGTQGPQVVRDEGGAQPQHLSGVADAVLPVAQQGHDPRPVRFRHGLEGDKVVPGQRGGSQMGSMCVHGLILTDVSSTCI